MLARKWLFNFILLAASLLACLLILEIGVRLYAPQYKKIFTYNEVLGVTRIPNSSFTYNSQGDRVVHKVNAIGFKTPQVDYKKPAGTYRVVLLGDSMTEAIQVSDSESFRSKLENLLKQSGKYQTVEVINLGYSGYGTTQEYLALKEYGLRYEPDLVILNFLADNDVGNNSINLEEGASKPFFETKDDELRQVKYPEKPASQKLASIVTDYFVLPRFLYIKLQSLKSKQTLQINDENFVSLDVRGGVYYKEYNNDWTNAWDITKALILASKNLAENNAAEFLLVSLPTGRQTDPKVVEEYIAVNKKSQLEIDVEKPERILAEFTSEEKINYLSLLDTFRKQDNVSVLYIPNDGHLSEQGHNLVANSILEYLTQRLNFENEQTD